ncbi:MAG: hypothetical protein RI947_260 [Candidatus Parcubacteria bacterium]
MYICFAFILLAYFATFFMPPVYAVNNQCLGYTRPLNVGESACDNSTTLSTCTQANPNVDADWVDTNCPLGCTGPDGGASCQAQPTNTPMPTSTPIPTGGGDCTITDLPLIGAVNPPVTIPSGQAKCVLNVGVSCAGGTPAYENCSALMGSCQQSGTTTSCSPQAPTATPTPVGSNGISVYAQGQLIPRPGSNCGVIRYANAAERAAAVAAGEDLTQSNDACCYSKLANAEIPDPQIDVIWVGDFISGMVSVLNTVLDQMPFIGVPTNIGLFNVGKLKAGLQSINAQKCYDGPQYGVGDPAAGNCYCMGGSFRNLSKYCDNSDSDAAACKTCMETGNGIYTAIGCIKNISNIQGLVTALFNVGLGISGGFAFMCIIYAAFILQTSQGNPERLKKSRDLMTSCITGLLLIIFSIFILRVIGVQILQIPGFT